MAQRKHGFPVLSRRSTPEMTASIEFRGRTFQVKTPQTLKQVLAQLKLDHESYLLLRDGKLLDIDEKVFENDIVQLIPVVAGG